MRRITEGAVIAALYAVITLILGSIPGLSILSYGQFRITEALTILPMFTASAIPGLTIGCMVANFGGVLMGANIAGWWDVLFGSLASLMAAVCTYWLRNIKIGKAPVFALLPPAIFNGLIIGAELSVAYDLPFWAMAGQVAFGELVICFILGLPLYFAMLKTKVLNHN